MRLRHVTYLMCSLVMAFCLSVSSAQVGEPETSTLDAELRIDGAVEQPMMFHAPNLATLPRQTI